MSRPYFAGTSLLALMLNAPIIGVRKRWPNVLHAVTVQGIPAKGLATSACGETGLRIVCGFEGRDDTAVPWPPRVRSLPPGKIRCAECQRITGNRRPRSNFAAAS